QNTKWQINFQFLRTKLYMYQYPYIYIYMYILLSIVAKITTHIYPLQQRESKEKTMRGLEEGGVYNGCTSNGGKVFRKGYWRRLMKSEKPWSQFPHKEISFFDGLKFKALRL
ncbi:hypothetical protein PanWU01x14_146410, partial [Parasponia andersonii]